MKYLKEIRKLIKEKVLNEKHAKSNVIKLETAYKLDNPKCEECKAVKNLTYDHIIPQKILIDFNINPAKQFWEKNSQVLCYRCNQRKKHSLYLDNPKTINLLEDLIKIAKNETII